jgi:ABC-type phosphate transport system auxiliary subunit
MDKSFYEHMWHTIKSQKEPFEAEIENRRKNGEIYQVITRISPIFDSNKNLVGFLGTEEDITQRLKLKADLKQKVDELEKINNLMVGRELKMRGLKERIAKLQLEIKNKGGEYHE